MFVRKMCIAVVLFLLSTTLFVFVAGNASADTNGLSVPVSGKVIDSDGNPLSGINVALENGTFVNTDSLGNFIIMCSPGEHTLTVSDPSISDRDLAINVGDSGLVIGNIEVMKSSAATDMTMNLVFIAVGLVVTVLVIFLALKWKKAKK